MSTGLYIAVYFVQEFPFSIHPLYQLSTLFFAFLSNALSLTPFFISSVIAAFYYGDTVHPSWDPPRIGFVSTVPIVPILIHGVDVQVDVEGGEDVEAKDKESKVVFEP